MAGLIMFRVRIVLLAAIFTSAMASNATFIPRQNAGVVFKKMYDLIYGNSEYRSLFFMPNFDSAVMHKEIRRMVDTPLIRFNCSTNNTFQACYEINRIIDAINQENLETARFVNETSDYIHAITDATGSHLPSRKRTKRGALDFVGQWLNSLFGVATESESMLLNDKLQKIAQANLLTSQGVKHLFDDFTSFSSLSIKQFNDILIQLRSTRGQINGARRMISEMSGKMHDLETLQHLSLSLLLNHVASVANGDVIANYLNKWRDGINQLVNGKISPDLLREDELRELIVKVTEKLAGTNYTLVSVDVHFYYRHGQVAFTKTEEGIYLVLYLPISNRNSRYDIFKIHSVPVPVSHRASDVSIIRSLPTYFAVSTDGSRYIELQVSDLQVCRGESRLICSSMPTPVHAQIDSCALSLFRNNWTKVMQYCNFDYHTEGVQRHAIDLGEGYYLLSGHNISHQMICANSSQPVLVPACDVCYLQLMCNCQIISEYLEIAPRVTGCNPIKSHQIFGFNFPATHLFNPSLNFMNISASTVFHNEPKVKLPTVNVQNSDTLGDTKYINDLKSIVRKTQGDQVVYGSVQSWMESKFQEGSKLTVALGSGSGFWSILLTICVVYLLIRVRQLNILVLSLSRNAVADQMVTLDREVLHEILETRDKAIAMIERDASPDIYHTVFTTLLSTMFVLILYILFKRYRLMMWNKCKGICDSDVPVDTQNNAEINNRAETVEQVVQTE